MPAGTWNLGRIRRTVDYINSAAAPSIEFFDQTAELIMSENPKWVTSDTLALSALELMEKHAITSLFVYSDPSLKKPDGIVHIHDILKTGVQ